MDSRLEDANLRAKRLITACEALQVRLIENAAIDNSRPPLNRIFDDAYQLVRIGLDALER